ncbi:MAG TPA: Asp-tRNA(Asn)/Glu-tRNA(Gln) amidotransferase subunit GatC [Candidatus Paceibacterota bacterium]
MVTKEEIKNLASLSRMEMFDSEAEEMTKEIDSILGYVGAVQTFSGDTQRESPKLKNVLREDIIVNNSGEYTEKLLSNAPSREGDYLVVKKIL